MKASSHDNEPADFQEVRVGLKLKHTRLLKGMTLKQLAGAAGCSESLVSKIENGRANPSLKMLHRVAAALGMPVAGLFQHNDPGDVVLRRGERPVIETDQVRKGHGIRLEALIPNSSRHLLAGFINHIEPGGSSDGDVEHEGEEFGYVLEGTLELTVAGTTYHVGAGDCFHFRSERPHAYRNPQSKVARVIWINTPPTF